MIASSLSDAFVDGFTILVSKFSQIDYIDTCSYRDDLMNDFLSSSGIKFCWSAVGFIFCVYNYRQTYGEQSK